jgi:hypothetical protein
VLGTTRSKCPMQNNAAQKCFALHLLALRARDNAEQVLSIAAPR